MSTRAWRESRDEPSLSEVFRSVAVPTNTGDGLRMAMRLVREHRNVLAKERG